MQLLWLLEPPEKGEMNHEMLINRSEGELEKSAAVLL